jgi:hypothetical protein
MTWLCSAALEFGSSSRLMLAASFRSAGIPPPLQLPAAHLPVAIETGLGVALWVPPIRLAAIALSGALLVAFSGWLLATDRGGTERNCYCFGAADERPRAHHLASICPALASAFSSLNAEPVTACRQPRPIGWRRPSARSFPLYGSCFPVSGAQPLRICSAASLAKLSCVWRACRLHRSHRVPAQPCACAQNALTKLLNAVPDLLVQLPGLLKKLVIRR